MTKDYSKNEGVPINIPKILIISETFKSNSGGGITLSNLFKDYPKQCIANAIEGQSIDQISSDQICSNFYCLGNNEKKSFKLFAFLQKKYPSGRFIFERKNESGKNYTNNTFPLRSILVSSFFTALHFFGLYHLLYRYTISDQFKAWVLEFKPDFIYSQLSSRDLIDFTNQLVDLTGASLAIHIMDDWPSTISRNGLFRKYWRIKIDGEFRALLNRADVLLSISEGMSLEYKKRYKKEFAPFHNPIEVESWSSFSKKELNVDLSNVKILYAGRIGLGTSDSIIDIAKAIEEMNKGGHKISFQIQTTTSASPILDKLKSISCVRFNPMVDYSAIPQIFSSADILVMPIDFSKKGIDFLKFSMPTKASEYMMSGSPILLYADKKVSLYDHARKYEWAYTVSERNIESLKVAIIELATNMELRTKLSNTALNFAKTKLNSTFVREEFHKQFNNSKNNV